VPFPKALARFNRDHLNRLMLVLAPIPPFAALTHRGRTTGREYRIVLNAWPCGDRFAFALTYGEDSDWVRNVLAHGAAELEWRRRRIHLHQPQVVGAEDARPCIPAPIRAVLRAGGVDRFLLMERNGDEAA
jgi:deazaflavin-dependent oxidoreductase (nitroreductase family)